MLVVAKYVVMKEGVHHITVYNKFQDLAPADDATQLILVQIVCFND